MPVTSATATSTTAAIATTTITGTTTAAIGAATGPKPRETPTQQAICELLDALPRDVLDELNAGTIDLKDPAFLDGLTDHISRLAIANRRQGQCLLGKIIKLKKLIARTVRETDPDAAVSATITRTGERAGPNDPCPCGSGRKYKQCCRKMQNSE